MYNLIVAYNHNAWEGPRHRISKERYLNNDDYTSPGIRAAFHTLSNSTIQRLCSIPTLFMYELDVNQPGFLGSITKITSDESQIEISFHVDRRTPIEWQQVDYFTTELGIIDRGERKTTHWAIKDVDIRTILEQARSADVPSSLSRPRPLNLPGPRPGDVEPISPPRSAALSEHDASLSILFLDIAGWSKLDASDIRLFVKAAMPEIDGLLASARMKNTWGDAVVATFDTERMAAETALHIRDYFRRATRDRVPKGLKARVSLHRGAVLYLYNPIRQEMDIFGHAVHLAARLEPKTPVDDVYCTRAIADALRELEGLGPAAHHQGAVELPKDFGTHEVYSVRWNNEAPPTAQNAQNNDSAAGPSPRSRDAHVEDPPTAKASGSDSAADSERRKMGLFSNSSNERETGGSRARSLVGDVEESERYIAVAPHGADAGGLGLTLEALVRLTKDLHVDSANGSHRFPPVPMEAKGKRMPNGLLWEDPPRGIKLAVGTDGSVALRYRLYNDQLGEGAQRGDIGLFATLELLYGAIKYSTLLQAQTPAHTRPALWLFRLEFRGVENRKLRHDPPQPLRTGPAWSDTDPCCAREIAIAGFYGNEVSASVLGQQLDEVASTLATYFSIENTVRLMKAGSRVAGLPT